MLGMVAIKTSDILKNVQETLAVAELGSERLSKGTPEVKLCGLRNLVAFGRSVTIILQKLRSTEPDFDDWYKPYRDEMKSDPLLSFFNTLRNKILKEGILEVSTHVAIRHFRVPEDLYRFGPAPPNAKGFFVGDRLGGSGWEIELPDGSIQKYYVDLPYDLGSVSLHFPRAPKAHLKEDIRDEPIENLSRLYLSYLQRLVKAAKDRFEH